MLLSHSHFLSATLPRQTQCFKPGLSGKLVQRAMEQACKLGYLEGCALRI